MGRALLVLPLLIVSALPTLCSDDPMIGTWQLNVSRSRYHPGPMPKSQVRVYATSEEGTQETVTTVNADGETVKVIFPGIYDGRDYPVTGSSQYDTIALHRIDDYTAEATLKHAGQEIIKARRLVSPDGKTMTITVKSADPQDAAIDIIAIYNKEE
jgi:hypothetical protein